MRTTIYNSSLEDIGSFVGNFEINIDKELYKVVHTFGTEEATSYLDLKNFGMVQIDPPATLQTKQLQAYESIVRAEESGRGKDKNLYLIFTISGSAKNQVRILDQQLNRRHSISIAPSAIDKKNSSEEKPFFPKTYSHSLPPGNFFLQVDDSNYYLPFTILEDNVHYFLFDVVDSFVEVDNHIRFHFQKNENLSKMYEDVMYTHFLCNSINGEIRHLEELSIMAPYLNEEKHPNATQYWIQWVCFLLRNSEIRLKEHAITRNLFEKIYGTKLKSPDMTSALVWLAAKFPMRVVLSHVEKNDDMIPSFWPSYELLLDVTAAAPELVSPRLSINTFIPLPSKTYTCISQIRLPAPQPTFVNDFRSFRAALMKCIFYEIESTKKLKVIESTIPGNTMEHRLFQFMKTKAFSIFQMAVSTVSAKTEDDDLKHLASSLFRSPRDQIKSFNLELYTLIRDQHLIDDSFEQLNKSNPSVKKNIMELFLDGFIHQYSERTMVSEFKVTMPTLVSMMIRLISIVKNAKVLDDINEEEVDEFFNDRQILLPASDKISVY